MEDLKLSFTDAISQLFIRLVLVGPFLHECGHLIMAALLGIEMIYKSSALSMVYYVDVSSPMQTMLIGFAGGLFEALCFVLLNYKNSDPETRLVNNVVIISSLVYAATEPFTGEYRWAWAGVGMVLGAIYFIHVILSSEVEL